MLALDLNDSYDAIVKWTAESKELHSNLKAAKTEQEKSLARKALLQHGRNQPNIPSKMMG